MRRGDSSKRVDTIRLYRQGLEQVDQVVSSGQYKASVIQALTAKRAGIVERLAVLEQSADDSTPAAAAVPRVGPSGAAAVAQPMTTQASGHSAVAAEPTREMQEAAVPENMVHTGRPLPAGENIDPTRLISWQSTGDYI